MTTMTTARLASWCRSANGPVMAQDLDNCKEGHTAAAWISTATCANFIGAGDGNRNRMTSLEV